VSARFLETEYSDLQVVMCRRKKEDAQNCTSVANVLLIYKNLCLQCIYKDSYFS